MKRVILALAILAALGMDATARTVKPIRKPRENFLCKEAGVPIRYSLIGKTLLGYENGGKPNVYDVQKNTARMIVATRTLKKPKGVVTISIDRRIAVSPNASRSSPAIPRTSRLLQESGVTGLWVLDAPALPAGRTRITIHWCGFHA